MDAIARIMNPSSRAVSAPTSRAWPRPSPDRLFVDIDRAGLRERCQGASSTSAAATWSASATTRSPATGRSGSSTPSPSTPTTSPSSCGPSAPAADPAFESITPDIPNAGWSEREYQDLLGMTFTGHPKPKRLVLADDWPAGIYPLRKEVPYNLVPPAAEDVAYQLDEAPPGTTIVPVGPFHVSLHEPEHFAVYVDGETIKGCDYRGFMTHRGIEKLCQTQVSYNEVPFVAERICGICGSVHAVCYAQAVEAAAGLAISRRAEYIRTIMLEIERLHSHLLWLGIAGHLIGFDTVFMQAWRVREKIMWLAERITGNRKTYGMIVIGGVRRDITPEIRAEIEGVLATLEKEVLVLKNADHRRQRHPPPDQGRRLSLEGGHGPLEPRRARGPGPRPRPRRPQGPPLRGLRRHGLRRPGRRFRRRLGHARRPRPRDLRVHQDPPPGPGPDAGRRAAPRPRSRRPCRRSATPCPWSRRPAANRSTTSSPARRTGPSGGASAPRPTPTCRPCR